MTTDHDHERVAVAASTAAQAAASPAAAAALFMTPTVLPASSLLGESGHTHMTAGGQETHRGPPAI